jgi:hypothetical protein
MRAQRPSKQPQRFASALWHAIILVHIVSALGGLLLALATHAAAWHGSDTPQSLSCLHASSLFFGAGSLHPRPGGSAAGGSWVGLPVPFGGDGLLVSTAGGSVFV